MITYYPNTLINVGVTVYLYPNTLYYFYWYFGRLFRSLQPFCILKYVFTMVLVVSLSGASLYFIVTGGAYVMAEEVNRKTGRKV